MPVQKRNLQRSTLQALTKTNSNRLIPLRIEYSEKSKLLSGYINSLIGVDRVYPHHLPTQRSFRWSTVDPPLTNWPRACINPTCSDDEHEWQDDCWSVRDILLPDDDEVMVSWDHDNIEGRIHDLIVNDTVGLEAHRQGYDLHTITCCNIFGYVMPLDLRDPHTSTVDTAWRQHYHWQGKDTKQRVLAKNFNHGSKYTETWRFVYRIQGIEKYGVRHSDLGKLARAYIGSKQEAWQVKLDIMQSMRRSKLSRTLYGGRRIFYDSSAETGREGFSHMISGTVSDYNNETIILFEKMLGNSVRLLHNKHDGDVLAIKKDTVPTVSELRQVIERPLEYQGRSLTMTAGIKVHKHD